MPDPSSRPESSSPRSMAPMHTVQVTLDAPLTRRSYPIHIGEALLGAVGHLLKEVLPKTRQAILLADPALSAAIPLLERGLTEAGIRLLGQRILPGGESAKSLDYYAESCEALLALQPDRQTVLLALGGGITGDLTGFIAASLLRGLPFVQIPTTLLAQVDSSVGGKTGINSRYGKNLIGAFHQPALVLADSDLLQSLPPRQWKAGYAEVVKYALINDAAFLDRLDQLAPLILAGEQAAVAETVAYCCRAKAAIVAADETEQDARALLNLGHTFGHALEAELHYDDRLLHGEAVSIGLYLAFLLSARLGLCAASDAERVKQHLQNLDMPWDIRRIAHPFTAEKLLERMYQDKKAESGGLTLILARGIGQSFVAKQVAPEPIRQLWQDALEGRI